MSLTSALLMFAGAALGDLPAPWQHTPLTLEECGSVSYQQWKVTGSETKNHIILEGFNICMDNGQPFGGEGSVVQTYDCHPLNDDEVNQSWNYTEDSTIVSLQNGTRCIGADASGTGRLSSACDQKFELKNGTFVHQPSGKCLTAKSQGFPKPLPKLNIRPDGIFSQGGSSGGDMAIQFHMAFSKNVSGVCGNDAQPYHCAVTRFPADELIPQTNESSVPFCYGCPDGYTVLYGVLKSTPSDSFFGSELTL